MKLGWGNENPERKCLGSSAHVKNHHRWTSSRYFPSFSLPLSLFSQEDTFSRFNWWVGCYHFLLVCSVLSRFSRAVEELSPHDFPRGVYKSADGICFLKPSDPPYLLCIVLLISTSLRISLFCFWHSRETTLTYSIYTMAAERLSSLLSHLRPGSSSGVSTMSVYFTHNDAEGCSRWLFVLKKTAPRRIPMISLSLSLCGHP